MNQKNRVLLGTVLASSMLASASAWANPPVWDSDYGTDTGLYSDDSSTSVNIPFDFPLGGKTYNSLSINSNGGIALGNDGSYTNSYVDYDYWVDDQFESEVTDSGNPQILPFSTDLDNGDGSVGKMFFKASSQSAVVTWVKMPTNDFEPEAPYYTFQVRLDANGNVTFSYLAPEGLTADMTTDLADGIVIGISDGGGSPTYGSLDFSAGDNSLLSPHAYELWCSEDPSASDCYEPGQAGRSAFDLYGSSVTFRPNGLGGWIVSFLPSRGTGDGGAAPLMLFGILGLLGLARRSRKFRAAK